MRIVHRFDQETKSTSELFNNGLSQNCKINVRLLVVEVFGKFGNAFSVRFRLKPEPFAFQKRLQLLIVCDDSIVNNREFPAIVGSVVGNEY